ncbi:MAG: endolysin/autolysin [Caudoviricetes sp.]|nr:MAG: endolysin/autolysin [Caudoviricetes sp.]
MKQASANLLQFIAAWELLRTAPYFATERERKQGIYTIGFGHTFRDVRLFQRNITRQEALDLLDQDIADSVKAVNDVAPDSLTQAQFDAMVDLVFNAGPGVIGPTKGTGIALRAGDIATLRVKLPQFRNQTNPITQRLEPDLGVYRRAMGRLALFDGATWADAEKTGRAKTLEDMRK